MTPAKRHPALADGQGLDKVESFLDTRYICYCII